MWEVEKDYAVKLGGNLFVRCQSLIDYCGQTLFNLFRRENDGRLGIDFDVYDKDGVRIATIRRSNFVQGDSKRFEFYHGADIKTMTDKQTGETLVRIDRRPFNVEEFYANIKMPPQVAAMLKDESARLKEMGIDLARIPMPRAPELSNIKVELDVTLRTYLPKAGEMLFADPDQTNFGRCIAAGNVVTGYDIGIELGKSRIGLGVSRKSERGKVPG